MTLKLFRLTGVCLILAAALVSAATAQTEANNADRRTRVPEASSTAQTRTTADENFEVNIGERRITEGDYEASVSVEVGEERGLNLRVGVAVGASQIDVLLRNVRGRVRFRATLEQILRRLDGRRTLGALDTGAPRTDSPSP